MVANNRGRNPHLDLGDAIDHDILQWPACEDSCGLAPDTSTIQGDSATDVRKAYIRTARKDHLPRALLDAGAAVVDKTDFRVVVGTGALEAPLTPLNFGVRELPAPRIAAARTHAWRVAVRQGPSARGDASNYIQNVTETPPAIRRSSLREAMEILYAPTQVGAPVTVNAAARLGFPRMGCQLATGAG